jgi:PadR family transcriptional regulator PadR
MDLLKGTLDLLILHSLLAQPAHGWAIAQRVESGSDSAFKLNQGSLYPALHKLEDEGLIRGKWLVAEDTRKRVKVYALTRSGRRALQTETDNWRAYARAMELLISRP